VLDLDMTEAAKEVLKENERVSKLLGINIASRTTTVKPDGHSALLLGGSSGVHSWHSPYYIRRMRVMKNEPIYEYLKETIPEFVEDERFHPETQAVISIPIKAPDGAITRDETALQMLNRIAKVYKNWIVPGYRKGDNNNNCSVTVTVKPHEWERVQHWLWENRNNYTAITVLPYDGGSYVQAPFEEITEEQYNELAKHLKKIDLTQIKEKEDNTKLSKEMACSGGVCELKEV
jgi:ribonucleoside-triphosphate reductase